MAEAEPPSELVPKKEPNITRKQIRQPPSVPFIWEEKPGTPKRDWKPNFNRALVVPAVPPPVKLVASVPFKWEEKPGKALICFSNTTTDAEAGTSPPTYEVELLLPTEEPIGFESSPLKAPPCMYRASPEAEKPTKLASAPPGKILPWVSPSHIKPETATAQVPTQKNRVALSPPPGKPLPWVSQPTYQNEYDDHESRESSSETDESFCSAPSLHAENNSGQLQMPDSPASSTTSSYATGTTSLVGASFLERLFPLLSPNSGFLEKQKIASCAPVEVNSIDSEYRSNSSVATSRPLTLGELIMMSRRRSCQRKAVQKQTQNLSMECMNETAVGCCIFGINNKIEGMQEKWKRQLKLM